MRPQCDVCCVTNVVSLKHCFGLKPDVEYFNPVLCELLRLVECLLKKSKYPYGIPALVYQQAIWCKLQLVMCPDSVVGIPTRYGLDGPGIESRWGRDFPRQSIPALGPTQPLVQWVAGLSRG